MRNRDEYYILKLCDEVLKLNSLRQHKFEFLVGDHGKNGKCRKLPVDGFYKEKNLVIEYLERQHTEAVSHFDKPNKMTNSGVHRGMQRKIYDERRRQVLPQHNIVLIEISFSDFKYDKRKRIISDIKLDTEIIKNKLKDFF